MKIRHIAGVPQSWGNPADVPDVAGMTSVTIPDDQLPADFGVAGKYTIDGNQVAPVAGWKAPPAPPEPDAADVSQLRQLVTQMQEAHAAELDALRRQMIARDDALAAGTAAVLDAVMEL